MALAEWAAPHGPTQDPVLCALACEVLQRCGGADHAAVSEVTIRHPVAAALRQWFADEIPDLLAPGDEPAIVQQTWFLLHGEGTSLPAYGQAVIRAWPTDVHGRPPLYEDRRTEGYLLSGPALSAAQAATLLAEKLRGMALYSAAFGRLAARHGVRSIPVYRGYGSTPPPFLHNAVACVGWTLQGATGDGVMFMTEVDPRCVVGITLYRECHPMIAPFRLDTGPAGGVVQWQRLA